MAVSYNNRRFRTIQNAESGDIRIDTIFQYHQKNNVVWAEYDGGSITWGLLIATVSEKGELDMRYAHVNAAGQLKTGVCRSTPAVLPAGRLLVREQWQWAFGDHS